MSYILEALKKSDRERRQGEIPDLQSVHGQRFGRGKGKGKFPLWIWLSSGLVLSLLALAFYWGMQRNTIALQTKISALEESVVQLKVQPVPVATHPPAVEEEIVPPPEMSQTDDKVAASPSPSVQGDRVAKPFVMAMEGNKGLAAKNVQQPVSAEKTVIRPENLPRKGEQEDVVKMAETLPLLQDLPAGVQKMLPPLKLAGHVYSQDAARRMIIINNRICREGDLVENQLVLDQILWEGVVLRYQEIRFRMNLL